MRAHLLVLVLVVLAAAAAPWVAAAAEPLLATITGPTALAPSQSASFNVTITGGPTDNVTYSVSYYISGANTTGGSPLSTTPGTASGNRTKFRLNVTAPTAEETISLTVNVVASPKSGAGQNANATYTITVIRGIVLTATFHNSGSTAALNVPVLWYVDGNLVGTTVLATVAPNADATATFSYLPVGLSAGQHTVTAAADLDHDGIIDPARGEVQTSTIFYSQVQQPAVGWAILLGIGVFIPVFLGVAAVRRRGERP